MPIRLRADSSERPLISQVKLGSRSLLLAALAPLLFTHLTICAGIFEARLPTRSKIETLQAVSLGELIDGLQSKYSRMRGIAADFVQVYQGNDGRTIRESGHLLLKRPSKARWDYSEPEPKLFVSDGKNVFFYVIGENHATKSAIKKSSTAARTAPNSCPATRPPCAWRAATTR